MLKGKCSTSMIDFVVTSKLDLLAVTETWLRGDERDSRVLADLHNALPDFNIISIPRVKRTGGGVCVILRKGFQISTSRPTISRPLSTLTSRLHMEEDRLDYLLYTDLQFLLRIN